MDSNLSSPNQGIIEKEYPYRYKWSSTLGVIISCGLGAFFMAWFAMHGSWFWWLGSLFMFVFFLGGLYIAAINLFGNRRLILTKESIYLPSVWQAEKYSLIRFLDIKEVAVADVQGNLILQLTTDVKMYEITHTWLPSMDTFNEILKITQERASISS